MNMWDLRFSRIFLETLWTACPCICRPLLREDNGLMIFCLVRLLSGAHWLTLAIITVVVRLWKMWLPRCLSRNWRDGYGESLYLLLRQSSCFDRAGTGKSTRGTGLTCTNKAEKVPGQKSPDFFIFLLLIVFAIDQIHSISQSNDL